MPAHKHAELIKKYAEDAAETETPWERWETKAFSVWEGCRGPLSFYSSAEYRRRPKTYKIGQYFRIENFDTVFLLSRTGFSEINLINLQDGNFWTTDSVKVENIWSITEREFDQLFSIFSYYKQVEVKYECCDPR